MKNNQTEFQDRQVEEGKSFYAISVHSYGINNSEPLQISLARYDNGVACFGFSQYYLPEKDIQLEDQMSAGLTLRYLQERRAVKWTYYQSKFISNFLSSHPNYPIVSHNKN